MQAEIGSSSVAASVLCPSSQPDWDGSVIIAVVDGKASDPRVIPPTEPEPVNPELLSLTKPVPPTQIFRFAAPCAEGHCRHFQDGACSLVTRIVANLAPSPEGLPYCRIRNYCRWWKQEGRAACLRCAQIVTEGYPPTEDRIRIANPPVPDAADLKPFEKA
jgi:hypothetical protein